MRFFHLSVEEFERLRNPKNCQLVVLEQNGKKYQITTGLDDYPSIRHRYQFDWSMNF